MRCVILVRDRRVVEGRDVRHERGCHGLGDQSEHGDQAGELGREARAQRKYAQ